MKNVKIFTSNIEGEAINQIYELAKQEAFMGAKIRIMPDVHAGAGCVVGFTADLGDKVIPNVVGVDIGCGMLTTKLNKIDVNLEKLDKVIHEYIPSGFNIHESAYKDIPIAEKLHCYNSLKNVDRIKKSLGTLGGGNHFIEVDVDDDGNKYIVIHTGSRNLGKQVADYYQKLAIKSIKTVSKEDKHNLIKSLKSQNRQVEIPDALKALTPAVKIPDNLAYLEGKNREDYLHDMRICQDFARLNRLIIAEIIIKKMNIVKSVDFQFETIHNYIDSHNIVRKGAIDASKDKIVLIPINMKDGCIIAQGLGNDDWNNSAPHGAGRLMSRSKAKKDLDIDTFKNDMAGIFSSTVNRSTLDESPRAYKSMEEIIETTKDTIKITKIIKPIYNFKAAE